MVKIFCGCDSLSVLFVGQSVPSSEMMFNRKFWQWIRPSSESHVDRTWNIFVWDIFLLRWGNWWGESLPSCDRRCPTCIIWVGMEKILAIPVVESALYTMYSYFFFLLKAYPGKQPQISPERYNIYSRGQIAGLYFRENQLHWNIPL